MGFIKRILSKWFSCDDNEPDITEKTYGNMVKFRIGSTVSISDAFSIMQDDSLLFKKLYKDHDFSAMIVTTILSFKFDGATVYRLYCENPQTMLQIHEGIDGPSYMLFLLSEEVVMQTEEVYDIYMAAMANSSVDTILDDKTYTFVQVFCPVEYTEVVEADNTPINREPTLQKTMSLFDRTTDDGVEYTLFDAELDENIVEVFVGLNVPSQEVKIY